MFQLPEPPCFSLIAAQAQDMLKRKMPPCEDDGAKVQIAMGLQPGQDIIVSPPAGLADGAKVKPAPQKPIKEAEN